MLILILILTFYKELIIIDSSKILQLPITAAMA